MFHFKTSSVFCVPSLLLLLYFPNVFAGSPTSFGPTILGMIHGIHSVIICNVIEVFFNSKTKKDEKTSMTLQINILRMKNMNLSKVVGLRGPK